MINTVKQLQRPTHVVSVLIAVGSVLLGCDRPPTASQQTTRQQTANQQATRPADQPSRLAVGPASRLSVTPASPTSIPEPITVESQLRFVDVHESLGVDFVYETGARGKLLMTESIGGGGGWLDFDRDGYQDLYCVQGGFSDGPRSKNPPNQLWQNQGADRFSPIQAQSGVDHQGYGQGVAIADFDNDGFDDIYVTNVGSNTLFHNQGDGTFVEATELAGVDTSGWSSSAAWGDLNGDGNLDLFVCNYLIYDPQNPLPCPHADGTPAVCDPRDLEAAQNVCFESLGDGTFREVTSRWGLLGRASDSKSLGTAILDFTGDGRVDVLVTNDTTSNFLFVNDGHGMFKERGVELGCAISGEGTYQASMGIAIGDYDRNHFFDIYMTHFTDDSNTLYANLGAAGFHDATRTAGLHQPTLRMLGFGAVMADFDRNGTPDLFVTNGHVERYADGSHLYEMPAQLFTYAGTKWRDVGSQAGPFFGTHHLGRAVASCDFDNDGDLDLAVVHQGTPAAVLRNDSPENNWLKVRLVGVQSNRSSIGTSVRLRCGSIDVVQQIVGGSSYCATHEPLLIFGLGQESDACTLEIRWPNGFVQHVTGVAINHSVTFREPAPESR